MDRELILTTLFAQLKTLPGLKKTSRRVQHWSEIDSSQQPYLAMGAGNQTPTNDKSGVPVYYEIDVKLYLYVTSMNEEVPPSLLLNQYLDRLDTILTPPAPGTPWPAGYVSLGGLVRHVWVVDTIETSGDVLGNQGVALIPLRILANA
jgi:hypothetical protein